MCNILNLIFSFYSVLNQQGDQRPNCLIIDEIDGSIAPVVNFLVDLIAGKDKQTNKSKKKGKKDIVLQRPIICICNDLYVPALRPLRQQALLVRNLRILCRVCAITFMSQKFSFR